MKAVVIDQFGGPQVLHVIDRELPEPGAGASAGERREPARW